MKPVKTSGMIHEEGYCFLSKKRKAWPELTKLMSNIQYAKTCKFLMLTLEVGSNCPRTKRRTMQLLPTPESPSNTNYKAPK